MQQYKPVKEFGKVQEIKLILGMAEKCTGRILKNAADAETGNTVHLLRRRGFL